MVLVMTAPLGYWNPSYKIRSARAASGAAMAVIARNIWIMVFFIGDSLVVSDAGYSAVCAVRINFINSSVLQGYICETIHHGIRRRLGRLYALWPPKKAWRPGQ
jgi:hypothetical protein